MSGIGQFARSSKQEEIMRHVLEAADAGQFVEFYELRGKLSYGPVSRQALTCSLNFLKKWGYIEKVKEPKKIVRIKPTPAAYTLFRTGPYDLEGE